jgi:guanylate kinase
MSFLTAKPILFVVSGPSGSGKKTFSDHVLKKFPHIRKIATYTTRAPRHNEKAGLDYIYLSEKEFFKHVRTKEIIEYTKTYGDYYYGSPSILIDGDDSNNLLVELDYRGLCRVRAATSLRVVSFFLMPVALNDLAQRIQQRAKERRLKARLRIASEQMQFAWLYDYMLLSGEIDNFRITVETVISAELLKREGATLLYETRHTLDSTLNANK